MYADEQSVGFRGTRRRTEGVLSANQKEYYRLTEWSYYPMTLGERKRHAIAFLGVDTVEPRYPHV